jgi:hypothetical protein
MEKELNALKAELAELKGASEEDGEGLLPTAEREDDEDAEEKDDEGEEGDEVAEQLEDLEEQISELNSKVNGNHVKFDIDFRTAYDNIQYKMADGSKADNDGMLTNRLWMGMNWKYDDMLSFTGQLAYNSTYGHRFSSNTADPTMAGFDWVSSEKPYDDELRVRKAYFFLRDDELAGAEIPWTFSVGRRPSSNGFLSHLREDDRASSPNAHTVNVEFDGASAKFGLAELIGVDGMYIKLCAGRGATYAQGWANPQPYAATDQPIDMGGIIFVPYDDGQYKLFTMYTYANNLIDLNTPGDLSSGFKTVGGLHTAVGSLMVSGIGDGISDFLDDTIVFGSYAMSYTDPNDKGETFTGTNGMLGTTDNAYGYSYWAGIQFPALFSDDGKFGLEYNHGSKYWRPITYAEDTMVGSKVAARGDAYEAYYYTELN